MYKYTLTNKRRSKCPFCGKRGKYSAFMNTETKQLAPVEYGMCSSCRKAKRPPDNFIQGESAKADDNEIGFFEADTVHINMINQFYRLAFQVSNNFIEGLEKKFGYERVKQVVNQYKLGSFEEFDSGVNSAVVFPYLFKDTHCCTGKLMWFDEDFHRIKEGRKKYPKFLHNLIYTNDNGIRYDLNDYDDDDNIIPFKLKLCLFGHHQIINEKKKVICLVESEKTAVIMSIVLPEYIWVASGGKTLIQDYKFLFFAGRKCLAFPDLSLDDNVYQYWIKKLSYYNKKYDYDIDIIDYYSEFLQNDIGLINYSKLKGFDIADFVLEVVQLFVCKIIKPQLLLSLS